MRIASLLLSISLCVSLRCSYRDAGCLPADLSCNPYASLFYIQPVASVSVSNVRNNGTMVSGVLRGTVEGFVTAVDVSLDGGVYERAVLNNGVWTYALPVGSRRWAVDSQHNIRILPQPQAFIRTGTVELTVRQGINRDYNGDGYADLVVGTQTIAAQAGLAYVFYGPLSTGLSLTSAARRFQSADTTSSVGIGLRSGDLNGDGYADLAVGANRLDGGLTDTGGYFVLYGSATGFASNSLESEAATVVYGGTASQFIGNNTAMADINGDGYDELMIGSDVASANDGAGYVLSGGAGPMTQTSVAQAATTLIGIPGNGDEAGKYPIAHDLNRDGLADFGFHSDQFPAGNTAGAIFLFHGAASGISSGTVASANTTIQGATNFIAFGAGMAVGDTNGDGHPDLMAGATGAGGAGAGYLFLNNGSGIALTTSAAASATVTLSGSVQLGAICGAGDLDGDGYDDFLISDPGFNGNRGKVYLFYGRASWPAGLGDGDVDASWEGENASDRLGQLTISAVDRDGDGFADLLIEANNFNSLTGRVYIFRGRSQRYSGLQNVNSADIILDGEAANDRLGVAF